MKNNIWLDGMMGLVVGDALGCPVQFMSREKICKRGPVTGMEGYGTYNMPEGTWTDDSSMALAALDSIIEKKGIDPEDIMRNFLKWYYEGKYTPFGKAFDQGYTCSRAILNFNVLGDYTSCGCRGERSNGNGALMRILPICIYYIEKQEGSSNSNDNNNSDLEAVEGIHVTSGLTHHHLRSQMACGLYYFMAKEIVKAKRQSSDHGKVALITCLQAGLDAGIKFYGEYSQYSQEEDQTIRKRKQKNILTQMAYYERLFHLDKYKKVPERYIRSTGYVVDSIEAAVWSLITTDTFEDCLLKAVNLGDDTDTVAAIAGGLAGLYYGYDNIPDQWLDVIKRREYIEDMCQKASL